MKELIDACWRAVAYCLHPRVILLSLAPLLLSGGLAFALGWFYWEPSVDAVQARIEAWSLGAAGMAWLESVGAGAFRPVIAPLIVVAMALPVIVVLSLLLVALLMTPAMVRLVAARRFPTLERRHGAGAWASAAWSLGCTVIALVALVVSMPLWLIPPLVLVLPPAIWGWLTYRVMAFDVLAEHATKAERRQILSEHRWPMLAMGIVAGYLGAAPTLIWAVSAAVLIFAPVLILLSIWLYTLVFAFSSLWFAHYALGALQALRARDNGVAGSIGGADMATTSAVDTGVPAPLRLPTQAPALPGAPTTWPSAVSSPAAPHLP